METWEKLGEPDSETTETKSQRSLPRDSLFLRGTLRMEGTHNDLDIRIRNLSATGLMADCSTLGAIGQPVMLETKGIGKVAGKIAWVRDGRMGIAFDNPVDPKLVRQPSSGSAPMMTPDYLRAKPERRPGLGKLLG
jgi:hypothetical protein